MGWGASLFLRVLRILQQWVLPLVPNFILRAMAKGLFSKSGKRLLATTADPEGSQKQILLKIVADNAGTAFGKEHGFESIRSIDDFRLQVPIRTYDELTPYLERMERGEWQVLTRESPSFFGQTSGTTGPQKLVPVTAAFRDEMTAARLIWYRQLGILLPDVVRGPILSIRSPKITGHTQGGIPYGSILASFSSAPTITEEVRPEEQIPVQIHLLEDFEARYYTLLRHGLSLELRAIMAVNPSTIVLIARKLDEHAEQLTKDVESGTLWTALGEKVLPLALRRALEIRYHPDQKMAAKIRASKARHGFVRPIDVWPKLSGLSCWKGGLSDFYLAQLPRYFGALPIFEFGYVATEGCFSVPLELDSDDGVLAVMGHFFEFIEVESYERGGRDTVLAHQLEVGRRYWVVVTASSGLYRYFIQDVVEVTGMYQKTPRIRFVHKGATIVSITGEKLTEHQVAQAVARTAASAGEVFVGFTVGLRRAEPPRYVLAVELASPEGANTEALDRIARIFDEQLGEANVEYQSKRTSHRLGAPLVLQASPRSFEAERERRVKEGSHDAHVKIPYLQSDEELIDRLIERRREEAVAQ